MGAHAREEKQTAVSPHVLKDIHEAAFLRGDPDLDHP